MSETAEGRTPFLRTGLGCFVTGFTAVATLLTVGGVWAYVALRDLDDDLEDLEVDIPDVDVNALLPPDAAQVTALDSATGAERWTRRFGHGATPVGMSNDVVVVRKRNGDLVASDVGTGLTRWRRSTSPASGYAQISDGTVIFIGRSRSLIALDAATGAERWRLEVASRRGLLAVGSGLIVVDGRDDQVHAIDVTTGATRWAVPFEQRRADLMGGSVLDDLVILRVGAGAVALEASTGETRWTWSQPPVRQDDSPYLTFLKRPIPAGPTLGLQLLEPSREDFPTTSTVFVDRITGIETWRTGSGALSSFAFDGTTLYEYGEGERLLARDPLTGAVRLEIASKGGRLLATPQTLFVGGDELSAIEPATGMVRWAETVFGNRNATALGVSGDTVLVGSRKFERVEKAA